MLASFFPRGRLLIAALLLAGCGVILGQMPAHACSCATGQVSAQTKNANDVFTGTVTAATSKKASGNQAATMTYDVDVDRVYKGDIKTSTVQVTSDRSTANCGLGQLPADRRYVFFAMSDGSTLTSDTCSGTALAHSDLVNHVEKLLGSGRSAVPPAPVKASFTRVAHADPTSLPRLAAPGAAMVLAGLMGLIVVRRLGRRS